MWTEEHLPCRKSPELFAVPDAPDLTAPETAKERRVRERAAVRLCSECPVWRQCREWALGDVGQVGTVCGGLTPAQLRVERRRRVA